MVTVRTAQRSFISTTFFQKENVGILSISHIYIHIILRKKYNWNVRELNQRILTQHKKKDGSVGQRDTDKLDETKKIRENRYNLQFCIYQEKCKRIAWPLTGLNKNYLFSYFSSHYNQSDIPRTFLNSLPNVWSQIHLCYNNFNVCINELSGNFICKI